MKNTPQPAKGTLLRLVRTTRKYPGEILAKDINSKSTEIEEQMASKPRKKDATSLVVKKKNTNYNNHGTIFLWSNKMFWVKKKDHVSLDL